MDTEKIVTTLSEMGGKRWQKAGKDRVYFNTDMVLKLAGLDYATYNTGRISGATFKDGHISNTDCGRILGTMSRFSFWFDLTDGKFYVQGGLSESTARWMNGEEFFTPQTIWKTARTQLSKAIGPFIN